jgi:hypothetical protein
MTVLHKQENDAAIILDKTSSKLDREEILLHDCRTWMKLEEIVSGRQHSKLTDTKQDNKRSRKAFAKQFKS